MGFQLVPKSVTLNGVMPLLCAISPNSVAFGANYTSKWLKICPIYYLLRKYGSKNLVF